MMRPNGIIPHSRPSLSESDIQAVIKTLKSGQLSQGPAVRKFENKIASYIGKKHAAATSSGTAALHLVLLALDVRKNDEIIIPSYVCSAVLNAVKYTKAAPIVVDIDPQTYNISFNAVEKAITGKTKAIIIPHMFGLPAEMDDFSNLDIPIIEDCALAIGATYNNRKAGSFGLLSIYSFYATKVLTSGEGGMVVSDSDDLISKIRDLRDYDNRENLVLRYNYKMTDLQASLGLSQFSHLENFLKKRKDIASHYFREFQNCSLSLPLWKEGKEHIYYRFVIKAENNASPLIKRIQQKNIICERPVYRPLHFYLNLQGFPHATEAWERSISIPCYPSLSDKEIEKIIDVVKNIF